MTSHRTEPDAQNWPGSGPGTVCHLVQCAQLGGGSRVVALYRRAAALQGASAGCRAGCGAAAWCRAHSLSSGYKTLPAPERETDADCCPGRSLTRWAAPADTMKGPKGIEEESFRTPASACC